MATKTKNISNRVTERTLNLLHQALKEYNKTHIIKYSQQQLISFCLQFVCQLILLGKLEDMPDVHIEIR